MKTAAATTIISALLPEHYAQVKVIYELGMATNLATLETQAPDWETWNEKFLPAFRLVAMQDDLVVGWAALTAVSGRCVYRGVAEDTVYIHPKYSGQGIGQQLLNELVACSEAEGFWTLQAGIFKENEASIKLHEKCGFRIVGLRERIGQLHGMWRDIYLMERRSLKTGL